MTDNKDISYRVALGGIVSSLCVLAMFLAGIIPIFYLLLPMIAGALMMIIVIEVNWQWAFLTYLSVGLLSLFITFDKQAAFIFIFLFGHYPILKFLIDRKVKPKFAALIIKFIIYNACILLYFYATVYLLASKELMKEVQKYGIYLLALVDFLFFTYDYSLGTLVEEYKIKIKPKITGRQIRRRKT